MKDSLAIALAAAAAAAGTLCGLWVGNSGGPVATLPGIAAVPAGTTSSSQASPLGGAQVPSERTRIEELEARVAVALGKLEELNRVGRKTLEPLREAVGTPAAHIPGGARDDREPVTWLPPGAWRVLRDWYVQESERELSDQERRAAPGPSRADADPIIGHHRRQLEEIRLVSSELELAHWLTRYHKLNHPPNWSELALLDAERAARSGVTLPAGSLLGWWPSGGLGVARTWAKRAAETRLRSLEATPPPLSEDRYKGVPPKHAEQLRRMDDEREREAAANRRRGAAHLRQLLTELLAVGSELELKDWLRKAEVRDSPAQSDLDALAHESSLGTSSGTGK